MADTFTDPVPPVPTVVFVGFWRRVLAFIIDALALSAMGALLGAFAFDALASLGAIARLIGFAIAALYFGFTGSRLTGGRGIGGQLLSVRVVDLRGDALTFARASVRAIILSAAWAFGGVAISSGSEVSAAVLGVGIVAVWLMLSILLLLITHRHSGQTLHDLAVGAFVERAPVAAPEGHTRPLGRGNRMALAVLFVVLAASGVLSGPAGQWFGRNSSLGPLIRLSRRLTHEPRVAGASVVNNVTWMAVSGTPATTERQLIITLVSTDPAVDVDRLADVAVHAAIDSLADAQAHDRIVVAVLNGYDLGIWSSWRRNVVSLTPAEWRLRLHRTGSQAVSRLPGAAIPPDASEIRPAPRANARARVAALTASPAPA